MRKVRILTVPGPGEPDTPEELGQMIENDQGEIVGTTELAIDMLGPDPHRQFNRYHKGYSNGYIQTKAA